MNATAPLVNTTASSVVTLLSTTSMHLAANATAAATTASMATTLVSAVSTYHPNKDLYSKPVDVVLKILYSIIASLGLAGNCGIIFLFATKKIKMTPFKLLLLNLSIADALGAFSIWPYIFIDFKSLRIVAKTNADALCVMSEFQVTYWIAAGASTFTLSLISISRYLYVCHPLTAVRFNKMKVSVVIVGLIWPTAIAFAIPNFLAAYDTEHGLCTRQWPDGVSAIAFSCISSICGFIVPVLIMSFTFFVTRKYFWSKSFGVIKRSSKELHRNRKTAIFLAALIFAFFICWSPFFVYWLLSRLITSVFKPGHLGEYMRRKAARIVILASLCNTVADPLIYGLRGEDDFRKSFLEFCNFILCRKGKSVSITNSCDMTDTRV